MSWGRYSTHWGYGDFFEESFGRAEVWAKAQIARRKEYATRKMLGAVA